MLNQSKLFNSGLLSIVASTVLAIADEPLFAVPLFLTGAVCAMIAYSWEFVPAEGRNVLRNRDLYADFKLHLLSSSDFNQAVALAHALSPDDFVRLVRVMCEARDAGTEEAMKVATELFRKERL